MRILAILTGILMMGGSLAMAAEVQQTVPKPVEMSMPEKSSSSEKQRPYEIEMEYLQGRFYKDRRIDRYNVHLLEKIRERGSVSVYRGLVVSRMTGYTTENGVWRDSNAWGLGPELMIRWEKPISGKLYGALEASGEIEIYNRAHPADGRAFGFLWRVGPRLTYRYTSEEALSLGYIFHHSSNGLRSHNPGYHGVGFSLGYQRSF